MVKYNRIYDEEIYELVNEESRNLVSDYMLELQARNLAIKTREQYLADIMAFCCYTYSNFGNKSVLTLRKRDFRNFFLSMSANGLSSARINRFQSSIRNLLAFAEDDEEEYPDYLQNPMKKIKSIPKLEVKEVVFIEDYQVTFLLDYLIKKEQYQKALYLSLSYDSAGRRNEIWQVEKHSFLQDGVFKTNSVTGKRAKVFPLMYSKRTQKIARQWLEQRGEDSIDSLWVTGKDKDKRALGYDALYNFAISFRAILESEYDEDIPLTSHSIRHFSLENYQNSTHHALQYMGKENLDLNTLRILANHNDISITQSYLKNKDSEILSELFSEED